MQKNKVRNTIFFILIIAFLAGNLSYPVYYNKGIDFLNEKFNWQLAHFWDIPFKLGLDLQGGSHLLYEADMTGIKEEDKSQSMEGLKDVIERRIDSFGVREPVVQIQKTEDHYRLIIELAGIVDPAQAIEEIGKTPFLEFKEPRPEEETERILEKIKEIEGMEDFDPSKLEEIENWELLLEDPYFQSTNLTGRYLKKAEMGFLQNIPQPIILIEFDSEGSAIFEEITERNIGKPVAIYIDDVLISAPVVQEKITGGNAQISGDFTVASAQELARNLNAGALPVPIELISQQSVGPTLGAISLEKSLRAGILGFLAIILFMIIFYRLPGVLASLALFIYIVILLSLFKLIPVTLSLAGIAGLILSLGMAVDANILIFARMKEEFLEGKDFKTSINEGFYRAWPSIRDGNFTTLIICFILFSFGTSFVKGFALTLGIGIIISIFSAVFITKYFLKSFESSKLENIKWLWG